ncbi:hypothetical protein EV183_004107 [Coemansia sp. RSA 2336]|nr:hypothetical protein EV183_004107 [Coemansia sp. RSA 2336]
MAPAARVRIKGLYNLPTTQTAVTPAVLETVADFFRRYRGRVLGLTGAGVSVLSGIPDYRGSNGTYRVYGSYTPILHHELVQQHHSRQRYWARSFFGIKPAFRAEPNANHHAFASLESRGYLSGLITQNVDGLHLLAGSRNVLELHGTLRHVRCLSCGYRESRDEFQKRLEEMNPEWAEFWYQMVRSGEEPRRRPDGDVDLPAQLKYEHFKYPQCPKCHTGNFMPTVVFFGGNVSELDRERSFQMVDNAEALLVCGTSLTTFSVYRLVKRMREQGKQVVIVNYGQTRGDDDAALKLETVCENILPSLTALLS